MKRLLGKHQGQAVTEDLFRQCKSFLLPLLHEVVFICWSKGRMPQDMRNTTIISLYKNNGAEPGIVAISYPHGFVSLLKHNNLIYKIQMFNHNFSFQETLVSGQIAGKFLCLVVLVKLLHMWSFFAYKSWPKEYIYILNRDVDLDINVPPHSGSKSLWTGHSRTA